MNHVDAAMTAKMESVRGYSAYEIALQHGFVGTEEEWLQSLVGTAVTVNGIGHDGTNNIPLGSEEIPHGAIGSVGDVLDSLFDGLVQAEADMENLESAVSGKLAADRVYNGLDKTAPGYALDARQGKALSEAVAGKASASDVSALSAEVQEKCSVTQRNVQIAVADWSSRAGGFYCEKVCEGVTEESCVIVRPAPSSHSMWNTCVCLCESQSEGSLGFACTTKPSTQVVANVAIFG